MLASAPVHYGQPTNAVPGYGLGIAALVLALCGFSLLPVILGLVSMSQAKSVGATNGFAVAGVVIGIAEIIIGTVVAILAMGWMGYWIGS